MNSLPLEMIREIYTKMDARSAYTFRKTCRDYNRVFVSNRSAIPRFDSILNITFKGNYIEVKFKLPKHRRDIDGPLYHSVNILEISDEWDDRMISSETRNEQYMIKKTTDIIAKDPAGVVMNVVADIRRVLRFETVKFVGRCSLSKTVFSIPLIDDVIMISQIVSAIIDNRLLAMLVDQLAVEVVDVLHFYALNFQFTEIENWYRLLKITNSRDVVLSKCHLHSLHLFTEDVVLGEMRNVSRVTLHNNHASDDFANVGLMNLLRADTIKNLEIFGPPVDCQEIINKLERFYNGDFQIDSIDIQIKEADKETLIEYLDNLCKVRSDHSFEDNLRYRIITKYGHRTVNLTVSHHLPAISRFQLTAER